MIANRCEFGRGDIIDGRYEVQRPLGEGSYGQVFKVTNTYNGNTCALKLLKVWTMTSDEADRMCSRFDMEYQTGLIDSKYLVHSLGHGTANGNPYIVMEFCGGGDLDHAMRQPGLNISRVAQDVLCGLRDLHANAKVHRDLKPANVLLRTDGTAVLTDFGISGDRNHRQTMRDFRGVPKEVMGTYLYMSPEQYNPKDGYSTVLPTTDIFAFGVMMYHILTGRFPFGTIDTNDDLSVYLGNAATGRWNREPLRNYSNWVALIDGCLKPKYKERLQTATDVMALVPNASRPRAGAKQAAGLQPAVNGYQLHIMHGDGYGKIFKLDSYLSRNCRAVTIGRTGAQYRNAISIDETDTRYISRQHCTIEQRPEGFFLRDGQWRIGCPKAYTSWNPFVCASCGEKNCPPVNKRGEWLRSKNGTFLNSTEVDEWGVPISVGDIISIGDVKIRVEGY